MTTIESNRTYVKFAQLGGTWLMRKGRGGLQGAGNFDDTELGGVERSIGLDREFSPPKVALLEKELAGIIYSRFKNTQPESLDETRHFEKWCPDFHQYVTGVLYPLFSGDSSHFRPALVAPMVAFILEEAIKDPNVPIIGAEGTDTADAGVLNVLDALVFDTKLPPFIFSGADRSYLEPDSDAPDNFKKLARLTHIDVRYYLQYPAGYREYPRSGVFWPYHNHLYVATDLVKISPAETREIEGQSTFFSPNIKTIPLDIMEKDLEDPNQNWQHSESAAPPEDHVIRRITMESLYDALFSVYTVDLGNQNRVEVEIEQILNPANRAVVVAAHGLGNTSNPIRWACAEATRRGTIVIDASRCLIGEVNQRYAGSLLDASPDIVSAGKFNKSTARAVAIRAILEGRSQWDTQLLFVAYHRSRYLDGAPGLD